MKTTRAATYTLYDGEVLDLQSLDAEQRAYLAKAYGRAWPVIVDEDVDRGRAILDWMTFFNDVLGPKGTNPQLQQSNGWVTREIWEHPFYRAVRDLDARLGMRQGTIRRPRGKRWLADPFVDAFAPISEIASRKSVSVRAVRKAIRRGELVTVTGELGGAGPKSGTLVSERSAKAWTPKRVGVTA